MVITVEFIKVFLRVTHNLTSLVFRPILSRVGPRRANVLRLIKLTGDKYYFILQQNHRRRKSFIMVTSLTPHAETDRQTNKTDRQINGQTRRHIYKQTGQFQQTTDGQIHR